MARKKHTLPFDKAGGVVAIQRRLLTSGASLSLSLHARCLLPLLQVHWRNDKAVDFSTREAAELLSCDRSVAMRAISELQNAGFIRLAEESIFNSRTGSRPRSWVLTWLPFMDRAPSNCWEKISISSGAQDAPQN